MPKQFISAPEIVNLLDKAKIKESIGKIQISFNGISVTLKQRDTVGNALQEWLCAFLDENNIYFRPNTGQTFPDFYLSAGSESGLCEMKSFFENANFDVANYRSYVSSIAEKPYRLNSDYLIFKYHMDENGIINISDYWCKKVWEITGPAAHYALKCQRKRGQIVNIRPITWYSKNAKFPAFESLPHLLNALYLTQLNILNNTHEVNHWLDTVVDGYNLFYANPLDAAEIKKIRI